MIKTELMEIANKPNVLKRNKIAKDYSDSIRKKNSIKSKIVSVIFGIVLGLIFGFFHIQSVSAADTSSEFSTQEWIDICYIARVVEAEAGNQTELGKRLVADTVLNRLNSNDFPSDVKSIVEQKSQYANGITASLETIRIVMEEYRNQTDIEVLYFRTGHYHEWATDLFQEDDHYFSK